jgi:hypothetical protein
MDWYWWVVVGAIAPLLVAVFLWKWIPLRNRRRVAYFAEARREFHLQRERLEAKFFHIGLSGAKRAPPRWLDCDFEDDVAYARNRATGELTAFVGVTIEVEDHFAPSSGVGDAVRNVRAATAVFRFDRNHWETDGRVIFNFTPTEAIRFYQRDLELLGREVAQRR